MEKMNPVKPLFPHLPERLAGLEELFRKSNIPENRAGLRITPSTD